MNNDELKAQIASWANAEPQRTLTDMNEALAEPSGLGRRVWPAAGCAAVLAAALIAIGPFRTEQPPPALVTSALGDGVTVPAFVSSLPELTSTGQTVPLPQPTTSLNVAGERCLSAAPAARVSGPVDRLEPAQDDEWLVRPATQRAVRLLNDRLAVGSGAVQTVYPRRETQTLFVVVEPGAVTTLAIDDAIADAQLEGVQVEIAEGCTSRIRLESAEASIALIVPTIAFEIGGRVSVRRDYWRGKLIVTATGEATLELQASLPSEFATIVEFEPADTVPGGLLGIPGQ